MLETKRLYIRHLTLEDAYRLSEYRNKPEVSKYQSWKHYTLKDANKRIKYCLNHTFTGRVGDNMHLAITLKDSTMIGDLYIQIVNPTTAMIGYTLDSDYWHNGYAREAVYNLLVCLKEDYSLKKVTAYVYQDNYPSKRLLLDLGFHKFTQSRFYHDEGYIIHLDEIGE